MKKPRTPKVPKMLSGPITHSTATSSMVAWDNVPTFKGKGRTLIVTWGVTVPARVARKVALWVIDECALAVGRRWGTYRSEGGSVSMEPKPKRRKR